MTRKQKPKGYWDLAQCKADAKNYETKLEWITGSHSSYISAWRNGWLGQCCEHMPILRKPNGYWTLARCKAQAKKFKTRTQWFAASPSSYTLAWKYGWLDRCCKHMSGGFQKPRGYWNLERCREDASKYENRSQWNKYSHSAYTSAWKNGWIEQCCKPAVKA